MTEEPRKLYAIPGWLAEEEGGTYYRSEEVDALLAEAAQGAAPRAGHERAEGQLAPIILPPDHPLAAPRAEGLDAERLRMAAERVIASFDWRDGPLPIITDSPLAFGNAVNRLREALSRPSDERDTARANCSRFRHDEHCDHD